ncbi:LysR family transcriptional regulator [Roseomonas terrae]|uniref:LysR family transcriptional regulator n=1 Tax=Neoroseomonas terrae TaxID=424799 RepID=A0ABS5EB56_9PROT|nr:LysR substrate-binding domain-containing protein [Neoroseomonas terrae]MBR0648263.1 LysR family transcriptional regulator [Neoroseomonas terrae]
MELRHLRYFVVLAEELHFSRAADRLGISQPPLSQQIRALEEDLQVRLLDRTSRSVELTAAGRLFLAEARATLDQADRARQTAARAHRGEIGELTVGLYPSALLAEPVASAILAFRRKHPRARLELRERAVYAAVRDMAGGTLEIAFLRYATPPEVPPGFALTEVMREPMMLVVHQDHRLATHEPPVPLEELAQEPFIHFSPRSDSGMHEHVAALCATAGFEPRIEQEANQNGSILALIGTGLGISILPRSLCRLSLPELRVLPIASPAAMSGIFLAYRKRGGGPLLGTLVELALAAAKPA